MNEAPLSGDSPAISLVTPAYNESENLEPLLQRIIAVMDSVNLTWEWIVVDDHSSDATFSLLFEQAARDCRVRGLRLTRNFGSHAATLCGLAAARGGAAIVLAGDGQDPPEEIPRLIAEWRGGASIVWAERSPNGDSEQIGSRAFHRLLRRWSGLGTLAPRGSDFFLITRPVIDIVNSLGERNTNVTALLAWIGIDPVTIEYKKRARERGVSGWTAAKKFKLTIDSILGFSVRPVQIMSIVGILVAMLGFLYAGVVIANAIFGRPTEGWSSLIVVVLVIGGIQMMMLGVLGEYLWRALDESRGRPRYIIERRTDHE